MNAPIARPVRALTEADAQLWWDLRLRALQEEPFAFGSSVDDHRALSVEVVAERFRRAPEESFTLGAFDGDCLVGMATFHREGGAKERHKGRIYGVYVAPEIRGLGVGKALLRELVARVRHIDGVEQLLLSASTGQESALALYRSLGFAGFGIEPKALKVDGRYIDEEHMILRLLR